MPDVLYSIDNSVFRDLLEGGLIKSDIVKQLVNECPLCLSYKEHELLHCRHFTFPYYDPSLAGRFKHNGNNSIIVLRNGDDEAIVSGYVPTPAQALYETIYSRLSNKIDHTDKGKGW